MVHVNNYETMSTKFEKKLCVKYRRLFFRTRYIGLSLSLCADRMCVCAT